MPKPQYHCSTMHLFWVKSLCLDNLHSLSQERVCDLQMYSAGGEKMTWVWWRGTNLCRPDTGQERPLTVIMMCRLKLEENRAWWPERKPCVCGEILEVRAGNEGTTPQAPAVWLISNQGELERKCSPGTGLFISRPELFTTGAGNYNILFNTKVKTTQQQQS